MIYELEDTTPAAKLFEGWQETLITSCLQKVMGKILVTDPVKPESAMASLGCFVFAAGKPDRELILAKPDGFIIMVPQNGNWAALIEDCWPDAKKFTRYAIRKDTRFDIAQLERIIRGLPAGYKLKAIDAELYDLCLLDPVTADFVSTFGSKERYLTLGRGVVILKDGRIVSGASSYSRYREGIEIEVDTIPEERHKGLASIACASLILRCLEEGLYPSWDAHNMDSVGLAEKLGYEFDHAYTAYELSNQERTH